MPSCSPGLRPPLSVHRPQLLPGDGELGRVDHFGFPAAVGELQRAVPLALRFAHDGVGLVVFDLCRHPEFTKHTDCCWEHLYLLILNSVILHLRNND